MLLLLQEEAAFSLENSLDSIVEKLSGWLDAIILKLPNLLLAIVVMIAFYFIAKLVRRVFKKILKKSIKQASVRQIIAKGVYYLVLLIGFFIALGVLDLDKALTSILAGAGVAGLAIGFALQGTLSNTVSGVVLSFLDKINIDDYVECGGYNGFITEITLRNIVIRQPNNEYVIIPNAKIVEEPFVNYSLSERSRVSVSCGVGYESDLEQVESLVRETISNQFTQKDHESVEFMYTEFGASSVNFMVRYWIDCSNIKDKLIAEHKGIKAVFKAFGENDINIPFPIRTLDFGKNKLNIAPKEE